MNAITGAGTLRCALVGTPNCGKTALFNALTGSRQKVANYPGVTVERKSGVVHTPSGLCFTVVDLPGTYSLRARSPDEEPTPPTMHGSVPISAMKRSAAIRSGTCATNTSSPAVKPRCFSR